MKTVIITGASRGIGRAIAKKMILNGYNVILNYNHSIEEVQNLLEEMKEYKQNIEIYKADVSNREEVNNMVDFTLKRFKSIDILVNNAGIAEDKLFLDITEEDWDNMMNVNLKGVFNVTQSVLNHMISEKKGKIINIASIWGMVGASMEVHYSTSKAGIIGFTKALAKEVGPSNITVNSVSPGVIKTDMLNEYTEEELNNLKYETPLMKLGNVEDVAEMVVFLSSSAADFITGQNISVNGGFVI